MFIVGNMCPNCCYYSYESCKYQTSSEFQLIRKQQHTLYALVDYEGTDIPVLIKLINKYNFKIYFQDQESQKDAENSGIILIAKTVNCIIHIIHDIVSKFTSHVCVTTESTNYSYVSFLKCLQRMLILRLILMFRTNTKNNCKFNGAVNIILGQGIKTRILATYGSNEYDNELSESFYQFQCQIPNHR